MFKMSIAMLLLVLVSACTATVERKENCTPQWPPGPCAESSSSAPPRAR